MSEAQFKKLAIKAADDAVYTAEFHRDTARGRLQDLRQEIVDAESHVKLAKENRAKIKRHYAKP